MIAEKYVDLYARNSGLRDKLVAERDVVLTYALKALVDTRLANDLAFKGGTCLRKVVFGSAGRFSEDLDFTLSTSRAQDDVLQEIVEVFNQAHFDIRFMLDDYYLTEGDRSFGGDVLYRHAWNASGRFRLQVSLREHPTLPVRRRPMKPQAYFKYLEFEPVAVATIEPIEMIAEKLRAAFQRAKVRDLHDLHAFAGTGFDGEILRRLVVLKLWQVRDPFDPDVFFERLHGGRYDWDDVRRLTRLDERLDPQAIAQTIETRYAFLRQLSELEQQVIRDARTGRNEPIAARLRAEVRKAVGP
ncbi:MAG: nucleotidyl transferase AbiEii/AbiGii toxin family protein [Deltaproteobacteria bacterium]|nr:nucleotidyl transferase AbiEii/AbiGii toxin family protein [Deltaproteobacteria bacterium]